MPAKKITCCQIYSMFNKYALGAVLFCFHVVIWNSTYLPMSFEIALPKLGQSYGFPRSSEAPWRITQANKESHQNKGLYIHYHMTVLPRCMGDDLLGLEKSSICSISNVFDVTSGPLLLTWINFNPNMDRLITCPVKCGMKLLIHSQTSTVVPLKFGNG